MTHRVYLDHAATTPLDPRVLQAMLPALTEGWGNPSSIHAEGRAARKALDGARRTIAELLGARPAEIVLTSGGTEADVLAVRGVVAAARARTGSVPHVVTTPIEHHAVLHTVQELERVGACAVTYLPVDGEGFIDPADVERAVQDDTALVSIMYANNEVGTIEPVAEAARAAKGRNPRVTVHTDAVQAAGSLDLDVERLGVDLLSLAAHKIGGPKGAGLLYVRAGTPLAPVALGGAQERDRRAGTENVAGAVGFAAALRLADEERTGRVAHTARLRDRLLDELPAAAPDLTINGPRDRSRRLANNVNGSFTTLETEAVLMHLDLAGIAASSGSACSSGSLEPSHVLTALGLPERHARNSLRLTVGAETTDAGIDRVIAVLAAFAVRAAPRAGTAAGVR